MKYLLALIFLIPVAVKGQVCVGTSENYSMNTTPPSCSSYSVELHVVGGSVTYTDPANPKNITVQWGRAGNDSVYQKVTGTCGGVPTTFKINVYTETVVDIQIPAVPKVINITDTDVTLSYNGTAPPGTSWYWQTSATGVGMQGGTTYTAPKTAAAYYLRAYNVCGWSDATSVSASNWTGPPKITEDVACAKYGSDPVNVYSTSTTDQWYSDSQLTHLVHTGNTFQISKADLTTYYIVAVNGSTVSAPTAYRLNLQSCQLVCTNTATDYTSNFSGGTIINSVWTATNGSVDQTTLTNSHGRVTWTTPGIGHVQESITYYVGNDTSHPYPPTNIVDSYVYISGGALTPPTPLVSYSCNAAVLSFNGTSTDGTWYWQYNVSDQVPTLSASTLNVFSPGTYYLRGYSACGWGSAASVSTTQNWITCDYQPYLTTIKPTQSGFQTEGVIDITDINHTDVWVDYLDGLGRNKQHITIGGSGTAAATDVVLPYQFDADNTGRQSTDYLPYNTTQRSGALRSNTITEQLQYYVSPPLMESSVNPYAVKVYEASPLNRVLKQGAPGTAWQPDSDPASTTDHTIKKSYLNNQPNEIYQFSYDPASGAAIISSNNQPSYYAADQLSVTVTHDEHQNEVREYMDKDGRMICKKVQSGTGTYASTYYLYDDFGNLLVVLPPEAVNEYVKIIGY